MAVLVGEAYIHGILHERGGVQGGGGERAASGVSVGLVVIYQYSTV